MASSEPEPEPEPGRIIISDITTITSIGDKNIGIYSDQKSTRSLRTLFTLLTDILPLCTEDSSFDSCSKFVINIEDISKERHPVKQFDTINFMDIGDLDIKLLNERFRNTSNPGELETIIEENKVYYSSINDYHFFLFSVYRDKVYVFQSFIGKYYPTLFVFERGIFFNTLRDLFNPDTFDTAFLFLTNIQHTDTKDKYYEIMYKNVEGEYKYIKPLLFTIRPLIISSSERYEFLKSNGQKRNKKSKSKKRQLRTRKSKNKSRKKKSRKNKSRKNKSRKKKSFKI